MRIMTHTVPASEAAHILRKKLGPLRAWGDFLADNIRGRQSVRGLTLKPAAMQEDAKGCLRPMYALADIIRFIREVLAREPAAGHKPITVHMLPLTPGRGWRVQKFDRNGDPIAWARRAIGFALPGQSLAH